MTFSRGQLSVTQTVNLMTIRQHLYKTVTMCVCVCARVRVCVCVRVKVRLHS